MSFNFNEKFESSSFRNLVIILTLMIVFSFAIAKLKSIKIKMSFVCDKILQTVTVWVQIYTYKSADWSLILQSSLLFFYITFDLIKIRVSSSHIMISFLYHRDHIIWSISLSSIDFFSSIDSVNFRENHLILVIFELSYSRIVNDSLNLIRRTSQVAFWH